MNEAEAASSERGDPSDLAEAGERLLREVLLLLSSHGAPGAVDYRWGARGLLKRENMVRAYLIATHQKRQDSDARQIAPTHEVFLGLDGDYFEVSGGAPVPVDSSRRPDRNQSAVMLFRIARGYKLEVPPMPFVLAVEFATLLKIQSPSDWRQLVIKGGKPN